MRHPTPVSSRLGQSLLTALISINARREVLRGPPHLPCPNPSRYVSCTNRAQNRLITCRFSPPLPRPYTPRPPCAADHDVTDRATSPGTSHARQVPGSARRNRQASHRRSQPPPRPGSRTTRHRTGSTDLDIGQHHRDAQHPSPPPSTQELALPLNDRQPARTTRKHARTSSRK